MIRVLIADDHQLVRKGIRLLLASAADIEIVGEAKDGREAVEMTARQAPDIVLMDVSMPHMDGVQATRMIRSSQLPAQVIMLTMVDEKEMQEIAEASGAQGYVLKSADQDELLDAIRQANRKTGPESHNGDVGRESPM